MSSDQYDSDAEIKLWGRTSYIVCNSLFLVELGVRFAACDGIPDFWANSFNRLELLNVTIGLLGLATDSQFLLRSVHGDVGWGSRICESLAFPASRPIHLSFPPFIPSACLQPLVHSSPKLLGFFLLILNHKCKALKLCNAGCRACASIA